MSDIFPIVPASTKSLWLFVPFLLVVVGVGGILGASVIAARSARFEVNEQGLRLHGDLYGRMIPASRIDVAGAHRVDLRTDPMLAPAARTGGTALPGYLAGWFRLKNGEKALLYVTDRERIAYVPTLEGYSVMLSVSDPDAFLASLRTRVGAASPSEGRR